MKGHATHALLGLDVQPPELLQTLGLFVQEFMMDAGKCGQQRSERDDAGALASLRCHDPKAFVEFVDRYRPMVLWCCHRLQLPTDQIDDVVSDTFARAYGGLDGFKGSSTLATWLWAIAYRQGISCLRRQQREGGDLPQEELASRAAGDPCPAQRAERREQMGRLLDAIERLPRSWATAIRLYYWQDQSTARIAEAMNVSDGVVLVYLTRGRGRLRALLAD
jgi:RNA polymerase sigma-70 factor (ECF subfamily)